MTVREFLLPTRQSAQAVSAEHFKIFLSADLSADDNSAEILTIRHGPARMIRTAAGSWLASPGTSSDSREAPTCMRCRGLTWSNLSL